MEPKVGDRVSLDSKKVGQPRRSGVVRAKSKGLTGARYEVRWDDGHSTVIAPGGGVLLVEPGSRAKAKPKPKPKPKPRTGNKAKAKTGGAKAAGKKPAKKKVSGPKKSRGGR